MGETPPRSVQLRFITKLQKELASTADPLEYAVSKKWVAAIQQFIEDDSESGQRVPPLSASDFDSDNIYVGEKSWRVLAGWYGVDDRYPFRRRCTVSQYISIQGSPAARGAPQQNGRYVLADIKLDFITSYCCPLKDLSSEHIKQPYVNIYFWESLHYVAFQLRCALKVPLEKDVRMWLSFCDDGMDVLLEDLSLYDQHNTSVGAVICEKYPDVLDVLEKRQGMPLAAKEELSSVFVLNQWQVVLCLETLPSTAGTRPITSHSLSYAHALPAALHNLSLDGVLQAEATRDDKPDFDIEIKQLLDGSVTDFNSLIHEQRNKLQMRADSVLKAAKVNFMSLEQECKVRMDETARRDERLNTREKELDARDHELNTKLAKFKSMLTEFLTNKDRFEKDAARMAEQNSITTSKVELNVGGVRYTTSLTTLVKEAGSLLHLMFSGQHAVKPDADGSYFIDRDGTHFRHVLNFLRDGAASLHHLPANEPRLLSELRTEAEHYRLHTMANGLRVRMSEAACGQGNFVSLPS